MLEYPPGPPSFLPRMPDSPLTHPRFQPAPVRRRAGGPVRAAARRRRAARGLLLDLEPADLRARWTAAGSCRSRPRMDCVVVKRPGRPRDHRAPPPQAGRPHRHGRGRGRHRGHRGARRGLPRRRARRQRVPLHVHRGEPRAAGQLRGAGRAGRRGEAPRRAIWSGWSGRRWCTRARGRTSSGSSGTATCRRCWPATPSRCTTSRRRSSAPRWA